MKILPSERAKYRLAIATAAITEMSKEPSERMVADEEIIENVEEIIAKAKPKKAAAKKPAAKKAAPKKEEKKAKPKAKPKAKAKKRKKVADMAGRGAGAGGGGNNDDEEDDSDDTEENNNEDEEVENDDENADDDSNADDDDSNADDGDGNDDADNNPDSQEEGEPEADSENDGSDNNTDGGTGESGNSDEAANPTDTNNDDTQTNDTPELSEEAAKNGEEIGLGSRELSDEEKENAQTLAASLEDEKISSPNSPEREVAAATIENDAPQVIKEAIDEQTIRDIIAEYEANRDKSADEKGWSTGSKVGLLLGGIAVAGLLGVALFSVSPVLALVFASQISEHIGSASTAVFSELEELHEDSLERGDTVVAAFYEMELVKAQQDAISEICYIAANYVRSAPLPPELIAQLKDSVK